MEIIINPKLLEIEVPNLRESAGWERRDGDYPVLFERCNFWAGARDADGKLIAFGYITGMGLQHGYLEDVIVHPDYQKQGIGRKLIATLLEEAERQGLEIVTLTFAAKHLDFYQKCGFTHCSGGIWRKS
ncbi:Acetyltransferase (GNAT) family protein [Paenibacillaceae bacterium GAS479]|nr:Acetyltransferase (GNAT) family protein [Paenibacillaceae bacterium GAS479]